MKNIQYSAVTLLENDISKLMNRMQGILESIPFEYDEFVGNHMTINLGPLKEADLHLLNQQVILEATHFGMSDKCFAVLIGKGGELSKNKQPHITIAVNRSKGGKMRMSNDLEYWFRMEPLQLKGVITEVANQHEMRVA